MPDLAHISIELIETDATLALRAAILRAGLPLSSARFDSDTVAIHVGAVMRSGGNDAEKLDHWDVVGVASIHREPPSWAPTLPADTSWRLRGMATAAHLRRVGVGKRLLARCVEYATAHGGERMWCNARTPAVPFYRACGWVTRGEEFEIPTAGPHFVMWRPLP